MDRQEHMACAGHTPLFTTYAKESELAFDGEERWSKDCCSLKDKQPCLSSGGYQLICLPLADVV